MSSLEKLTMLKTKAVISVVDDDESVCKSLQRLLRSMGFKVKTYSSALAFLHQGPLHEPGCVIVDVRMPEIDGLDLQKRLSDSCISLPVVFMTAYEDPGVRSKAMQAGALAFLQKPFSDQSLMDALCLALEQSRQIAGDREESMDSRQERR
jgi:FixJ family two-component response regulator